MSGYPGAPIDIFIRRLVRSPNLRRAFIRPDLAWALRARIFISVYFLSLLSLASMLALPWKQHGAFAPVVNRGSARAAKVKRPRLPAA